MSQQPYSNILGYDPGAPGRKTYGPANSQEWANVVAMGLTARWLNGDLGNTGVGSIWDNTFWNKAGVGLPSQALLGSKTANDPLLYNQFYAYASWLANNWEALPDTIKNELFPPPRTQYNLSPEDEQRIWQSLEAEKTRAHQLAIAELQARTSLQVAQIEAETSRYVAQLRAQTDKEIAALQAAIELEMEQGRNRRFDLQLEEERRQFNAKLALDTAALEFERQKFRGQVILELFKMGVQVAANPVDWVAHQYFMANYSIPLTMTNFLASAMAFGAIPPTGPSAYGPVTGGPGAIDGSTLFGQLVGVQPAFVPVTQAAQQFTGGAAGPIIQQYTAPATVTNIVNQYFNGDASALDRMVDEARVNYVLPSVGMNPVTIAAAPQLVQNIAVPPGYGAMPQPDASTGMTLQQASSIVQQNIGNTQPSPMPTTLESGPPTGQTGFPPPSLPGAGTGTGTGAGTQNTGMYLGTSSTTPAPPAQQVFNPSSFGQDLLQQLSQLTGLPVDQLQRVIPTSLIAGQYSLQQLANSPIIQAMQQGTMPSRFRSAPVAPNERFGNILALGIPMGMRGGQDFNLQAYLQGGPVNQQLMEGAWKAMGFDPKNFLWQAQKTAPMTDITPGLKGRRTF
jgi:hypothetical protein